MVLNCYRVTFLTKKGGDRQWHIDVEARTLKEAKEKAEAMWNKDAHMFHVAARRLKNTEEFLYHWFKEVEV